MTYEIFVQFAVKGWTLGFTIGLFVWFVRVIGIYVKRGILAAMSIPGNV